MTITKPKHHGVMDKSSDLSHNMCVKMMKEIQALDGQKKEDSPLRGVPN